MLRIRRGIIWKIEQRKGIHFLPLQAEAGLAPDELTGILQRLCRLTRRELWEGVSAGRCMACYSNLFLTSGQGHGISLRSGVDCYLSKKNKNERRNKTKMKMECLFNIGTYRSPLHSHMLLSDTYLSPSSREEGGRQPI